jgi:hypothetical protein
MSRWIRIALSAWLGAALVLGQVCVAFAQNASSDSYAHSSDDGGGHLDMSGYKADEHRSEALTNYLKTHKLPLVGAQVLKNNSGDRAVVLYGYTGSDFGKKDAASKTRKYLADSAITVDNRIKVRPELLAANRSSEPGVSSSEAGSGASGAGSSYADANGYPAPGSQAQQYAQHQNAGSMISNSAPLLMLGLMALSAFSGGNFQFGTGFGPMGGSPFGPPQPYNQYPGYPVMPGPGDPYGSNPYGP